MKAEFYNKLMDETTVGELIETVVSNCGSDASEFQIMDEFSNLMLGRAVEAKEAMSRDMLAATKNELQEYK